LIKLFFAFSSHLFSSLPGLTCSKFFNHSKYEHVTPPAFNKISGRITTPFLVKIYSAPTVVGPFAASAKILQLILSALYLLTDFSTAAGIKKSHGL